MFRYQSAVQHWKSAILHLPMIIMAMALSAALSHELLHHGRTNKTGTAGDEDIHDFFTFGWYVSSNK